MPATGGRSGGRRGAGEGSEGSGGCVVSGGAGRVVGELVGACGGGACFADDVLREGAGAGVPALPAPATLSEPGLLFSMESGAAEGASSATSSGGGASDTTGGSCNGGGVLPTFGAAVDFSPEMGFGCSGVVCRPW